MIGQEERGRRIAVFRRVVETAVRLESVEEWSPFVQKTRAIYRVNRLKRDAAFREIVLGNYGFTCAVTGQRFVHGPHVEAEAAHIISKEIKETDDPRNGLALSRTAHWAFDRGLFTITDQYEVLVHKKALDADHRLARRTEHLERSRRQAAARPTFPNYDRKLASRRCG